ncbi:MAG: hypothetical protein H7202_04395 [Pedobacter sp.]|nr:hypothetical protein [Pedobacter sp.]
MIENIIFSNIIFATIIRADYKKEGIFFFTPDDFSQQLGYMNRPKGYIIAPHYHNHIDRKITITQEVLYIKSGVVRVDFYTSTNTYLESKILGTGDVILLAAGAHGFEILEEAEIIEVKQGPYNQDKDKVHLIKNFSTPIIKNE